MHITEDKIEQFVFSPDLLEDIEKISIQAHLNECMMCKEIYDVTNNIHKEIINELNDPPTSLDKDIAEKIFYGIQNEKRKLLLQRNNAVEIYDGRTQIVERRKSFSLQNILYIVKNHPFASGGFAIVGALALAFIITTFQGTVKDDNPVYAEIKNGILEVYNSSGELLWKKTAGNLPDTKFDKTKYKAYEKRYLSVLDIDNDNSNEVLLSGELNNNLFAIDSLYCFDGGGKLKWTTSAGKFLNFGTEKWKHVRWDITDFFTVSSYGKKNLIVIAHDAVYAPLIISRIDPMTGNILSSYYNCGWNESQAQKSDVNNDGNEEIILGFTNNALRRASLLVISPDRLEGMSPSNSEFYPSQYFKGNELYYIVFPITNLSEKFARSYFYRVTEMSKGPEGITVFTSEVPGHPEIKDCKILYSLDKNMKVLSAIGSQEFNSNYDELYKQGVFYEPRDLDYFKKLVNSVRYWDGDKFVNYHTMNKYYSQSNKRTNLP